MKGTREEKRRHLEARIGRLADSAGTFVYRGKAYDTSAEPGIPMLNPDGSQMTVAPTIEVEQADGKKVHVIQQGAKGQVLVWRRAPKFTRTELDVFRLRIPGVAFMVAEGSTDATMDVDGKLVPQKGGTQIPSNKDPSGRSPMLYLEFPKGKAVEVNDPAMAIKCRGLAFLHEVLSGDGKAKAAG